ncbi:MAG: radical SAM family heme chaperone HemW [Atribacterota bacterium]
MSPLGIYVHIPFCVRRCKYCDFVSYPWSEEGKIFVELLFTELNLRIRDACFAGRKVQSVYFGGGTPSLLEPSFFEHFLGLLKRQNVLFPSFEVTLEVTPETVTPQRLKEWKAIGITRLSIGVQSLQPRYLIFLGRATSLQRIYKALTTIREEGWKNWNVDLIYGLPLQDFEVWQEDIARILEYAPPHVSIYNLTLEPRVPLYSFWHRHRRLFPSPEAQAYLFRLAEKRLGDAGYLHYEVSNFALPGFECQHNLLYWRNGEYVGLGPSAWTHLEGKRQKNASSLRTYSRMVRSGKLPVVFEEKLSQDMKHFESVALLLRTNHGVPIALLSSPEWGRYVWDLLEEGLLFLREGRLCPSSQGYLLLHQMLSELLARKIAP